MRNDQILAFQSFEATIPTELVAQWLAAVELWEKNPKAPNPFRAEKRCMEHFLLLFFFVQQIVLTWC